MISPPGRILIVGDSQSRMSTVLLKDYVRTNHIIETIVKPGATFESVVDNLKSLTQSFGENDYIIIIAGTNNILKKSPLNRNAVFKTYSDLRQTNCILVSVPFFNVNKHSNQDVENFNSELFNCVRSVNCPNFKFVDINNTFLQYVSRSYIHLTKAEKRRLFFYLAKYYLCLSNVYCNNFEVCKHCSCPNVDFHCCAIGNSSDYNCDGRDDSSTRTDSNFSNVIASTAHI